MASLPTMSIPTPQDLLEFQSKGGIEFIDGQLVEKPVSIESSEIEGTVFSLLRAEAVKARSVRVFPSSMGYRCFPAEPRKFRKPDVSIVRSERMAGIDPSEGFIPMPPDLAVEVLSPNDLAYDVDEKLDEYQKNGFMLIWVIHPNTKAVSIHRGDGSISLLHENDEITGETALPSFRCKVAEFFVTPA